MNVYALTRNHEIGTMSLIGTEMEGLLFELLDPMMVWTLVKQFGSSVHLPPPPKSGVYK